MHLSKYYLILSVRLYLVCYTKYRFDQFTQLFCSLYIFIFCINLYCTNVHYYAFDKFILLFILLLFTLQNVDNIYFKIYYMFVFVFVFLKYYIFFFPSFSCRPLITSNMFIFFEYLYNSSYIGNPRMSFCLK